MEDLRVSERLLKAKVKNMTNEIAMLKRSYRMSPKVSTAKFSESLKGDRAGSHRYPNFNFGKMSDRARKSKRTQSSECKVSGLRIQSSSPCGTVPRFDPTAYIEQKKKRHLQVNAKLG